MIVDEWSETKQSAYGYVLHNHYKFGFEFQPLEEMASVACWCKAELPFDPNDPKRWYLYGSIIMIAHEDDALRFKLRFG